MKIQTARRHIVSAALVAAFLLGAAPAGAQDRGTPIGRGQDRGIPIRVEEAALVKGGCPSPVALTLDAATPNVFAADFNSVQLGAPRSFVNDPSPNKSFLHTFQWAREQRCCEATRAVLTVKLRANQPGHSKTSSDAGNDGIAIMHAGSVVPPFYEPVYGSWPFGAGQTATKTWVLTGAALSNLNATGRVSVYAQDDSTVESATLQIYGCCLSSPRRDVVEEVRPGLEEVRPER